MGRRPSFAWRSIHISCGLIKEGLIRRVGNGSQIQIWKDRWLPNPSTFRVCFPNTVLNSDATVRELIDEDLKWWNVDLLERIFSKEKALLIQTIPLVAQIRRTCLFGEVQQMEYFFVKSAYHLQKELESRGIAECSYTRGNSEIWKNTVVFANP